MNTRTFVNGVLGVILLVMVVMGFSGGGMENKEEMQAEIVKVVETTENGQTLELKFKEGPSQGQTTTIVNNEEHSALQRRFAQGDNVMVIGEGENGYITDFVRTPQLMVLFALFIAIALLVTGAQGVGALIGMGLSFVVIFRFILPLILAGYSPVLMAIVGAVVIIPLTFYPSHGFSKKTHIAIAGTFGTLVVAGLLAHWFADYAHLTGMASEEANFLQLGTAEKIDFQGLILAGILISVLGILDDITISQASVVQQLKLAKKNIKFPELFGRSMIVGRDHIASLINTLILVYAGASLPLLLLFLDQSSDVQSVLNLEFIAEEVVRTLIGSIALILAVPITTLLAATTSVKGVKAEKHHCHH